MSRAKCHRESYENGNSLGVVSRLVTMNKFCWSILLEDKQKAKCGGVDKSQIYMIFTPIYLVFCIVYHLFWAFLCLFLSCRWCSSGKIEEQAKNSKKESKEVKMGKVQEHAAAWFCHAAAWGLPVKNPRLACPIHAAACQCCAKTRFYSFFFFSIFYSSMFLNILMMNLIKSMSS